MSYDLAVWDGPMPASDEAALAEFLRLMDHWQGEGPPYAEPISSIRAYVAALLDRWPDINTDKGEGSPWADGPMIYNATGPLVYFAMSWSMAQKASAFAADVAEVHGLVCFDPQSNTLRSH